ncbi:MAG: ATP-binding protein [Evtepia gabavorous]
MLCSPSAPSAPLITPSPPAAWPAEGIPNPRPGEISLAHHGVLFLDELPEFSQGRALETLRQPHGGRRSSPWCSAAAVTYPCPTSRLCAP